MEELLKPYVEKALKAMEAGGEFIIDQAPELIQQFYAWHIASNIVWVTLSLTIAGVSFYIIRTAYKNDDDWDVEYTAAAWVFGSAFFVIGTVMSVINILNLIKVLVAPKLYLIEHFIGKI